VFCPCRGSNTCEAGKCTLKYEYELCVSTSRTTAHANTGGKLEARVKLTNGQYTPNMALQASNGRLDMGEVECFKLPTLHTPLRNGRTLRNQISAVLLDSDTNDGWCGKRVVLRARAPGKNWDHRLVWKYTDFSNKCFACQYSGEYCFWLDQNSCKNSDEIILYVDHRRGASDRIAAKGDCRFIHHSSTAERDTKLFKQFTYVGCYRDRRARALSGAMFSGYVTRESCSSFCSKRNFKYFGLQYKQECWCGTDYGMHGALPRSQCSTPCAWDPSTKCGGPWANSVYRIN
jgi:hypothetical protein